MAIYKESVELTSGPVMSYGNAFLIHFRKNILYLIANQVHNGSFEGWVTKKSVVHCESVKTEGEPLTFLGRGTGDMDAVERKIRL